jgi:hypothetical protein
MARDRERTSPLALESSTVPRAESVLVPETNTVGIFF